MRVTFNKKHKHVELGKKKSNPPFYAVFRWWPLSHHPQVQHLPPKKGWLNSLRLYLLFPSFEVVYQCMLVSSLPYLFCAGGSPRHTPQKKKNDAPQINHDRTPPTLLLSILFEALSELAPPLDEKMVKLSGNRHFSWRRTNKNYQGWNPNSWWCVDDTHLPSQMFPGSS